MVKQLKSFFDACYPNIGCKDIFRPRRNHTEGHLPERRCRYEATDDLVDRPVATRNSQSVNVVRGRVLRELHRVFFVCRFPDRIAPFVCELVNVVDVVCRSTRRIEDNPLFVPI